MGSVDFRERLRPKYAARFYALLAGMTITLAPPNPAGAVESAVNGDAVVELARQEQNPLFRFNRL